MTLQEKYAAKSSLLSSAMTAYKDFWNGRDASKDLSAEEKSRVIALGKIADDLSNEVSEIKAMADRLGDAEGVLKAFNTPVNRLGEQTSVDGKSSQRVESKNFIELLGEKFADDAFVKEFKANPKLFKTLITSSTSSAGDLLIPQRMDNLYDPGTFRRELQLLDIIRKIPVTKESVTWPILDSVTNAAAPIGIAASIATTDDTGRYPESAMVWDLKSAIMKWVGHTIPVPESVLDDIPQLMGYVKEFMIYGILEELEDQFLTGDGTGENMTGILATTGIQTQAFSTDMFESLMKAKTKARFTGRVKNVTAVLTPANWETMQLQRDAESRFLMGGPVGIMAPTVWGMPVVIAEGLTANRAIVGDFGWCAWFDRKQVEVASFYENRDFAEKNLVGIRARTRAQFGVIRPKAFVDVTMA